MRRYLAVAPCAFALFACGGADGPAASNDEGASRFDASSGDGAEPEAPLGQADEDGTPNSDAAPDGMAFDAASEARAGDAGDAGEATPLGDATADGAPIPQTADRCGQMPLDPPVVAFGASGCGILVEHWPDEGHQHAAEGSAVDYCTLPPSSGNHYPVWAKYQTFTTPVPSGYLVHDLEHGAIVITYRCDANACDAATSDALGAIVAARPVDAACFSTSPVRARLILAPDPTLDVAVAAAAWQWTYRADCVDEASLDAFIDQHYNQAAEDICSDGAYPP